MPAGRRKGFSRGIILPIKNSHLPDYFSRFQQVGKDARRIKVTDFRLKEHPVIRIPERQHVEFSFNGRRLTGIPGEAISSALFANGIRIFGSHHRDGSPQGIFCANGQCAQCLVLADGVPVKSCMEPLRPDMSIVSCEGLPELPAFKGLPEFYEIENLACSVLILGAGPAGLSAAIELGKKGVDTLLVDDKDRVGGKLLLQTHKFFGSVEDCHAGVRGVDIARMLEDELSTLKSVRLMLLTTACAVFSDGKVGLLSGDRYLLVSFDRLLTATGAREKSLPFPGCTLPGVYGAGAFQTLVNRDLVKAAGKLFVIGGGNVGLIAAYHAIQAGILVAGLAEACPECGGYRVHEDKIRRLGVPVYTSHTVLRADGDTSLKKVTIAEVDRKFKAVPGTEKAFEVDTLLVAVGLNPVDEFFRKAREFGFKAWAAGDAEEIAEASSAMFSGKIAGLTILNSLRKKSFDIPQEWRRKAEVLKSRPGGTFSDPGEFRPGRIFPRLHCIQEIPCNPCVTVCPRGSIRIPGNSLMGLPEFSGECSGCGACVAICPGLAITLVDLREDENFPLVTFPFEAGRRHLVPGKDYPLTGRDGAVIGSGRFIKAREIKKTRGTLLAVFQAPSAIALKAASFLPFSGNAQPPPPGQARNEDHDCIICRCERVAENRIRQAIRSGIRDFNLLKAALRVTMGACGGKTCMPLIERIFLEEGVPREEIIPNTIRPLFVEVPLGVLAGLKRGRGR
jgi:NADPH-dependent 2,4-dienoyl-CoA reductase/sulfur reductase-like enzyme/NAD-dependent dihydropyrimidine dehydrogenase PreA subunit/bacterioferritin-associated ferredoxin